MPVQKGRMPLNSQCAYELHPSLFVQDSSPVTCILVHYIALKGNIEGAGGEATSKCSLEKAADAFEFRTTLRKVSEFVNQFIADGDAKIMEAAFRDARLAGVDSPLEADSLGKLSIAEMRKLRRVLEKNYGMPPDGEAFA